MVGMKLQLGVSALAVSALLALPGAALSAEPAKNVTFSKDVAPILQAKCQSCHEPGSIAPMSLMTYQEARPWARSIRERVSKRQMPPWHIDRSVGVQKFKNDMSLSDEQIDTIVRWVDGGAVQGDPKDLLLEVAQRMTDMPIPTDDVFAAVQRVYKQMEGIGPLLQDPARSSIRIVLNPERMVINESQRLYTYLSLFGFPVDAVVANRVLPEEARSRYFDRWFGIQAGHLAAAREAFDPLPFLEAPLFDREMVGTEMLGEFGCRVFGASDPAAVLHRGRPVEVKKEGRSYALYIRLPFAEKDRIQVWARGEELVVQVDNQRRHLVLPRTLAGRRVTGAAFTEQRLRVGFGEKEAS